MDNKKLKSSWAAAFTVASVWFGTHVGAGFATGNQVVNYFVQYGWPRRSSRCWPWAFWPLLCTS